MFLSKVFSSDLRKNLGEVLDKIHLTKVPMVIEKKIAGGSKNFILLRKDLFDSLLDNIKFNVTVKKDEDNEYILELEELDILSYGDTLEDAKESLKEDTIIYAEEYLNNIELYSVAPNRKQHLPYLLKIWSLNDPNNVKNMFKFSV